MKQTRNLLLIPLVCALTACATATLYHPLGDDGFGYDSTQVEDNRFRVTFVGNEETSIERVRNYLLFRAAEVTLSHGADYFVISARGAMKDVNATTAAIGGFGYPFGVGFGFGGVTTTSRSDQYRAYAVITVYEGKKPIDAPMAFDASEVVANLEEQVERPG